MTFSRPFPDDTPCYEYLPYQLPFFMGVFLKLQKFVIGSSTDRPNENILGTVWKNHCKTTNESTLTPTRNQRLVRPWLFYIYCRSDLSWEVSKAAARAKASLVGASQWHQYLGKLGVAWWIFQKSNFRCDFQRYEWGMAKLGGRGFPSFFEGGSRAILISKFWKRRGKNLRAYPWKYNTKILNTVRRLFLTLKPIECYSKEFRFS